MICSKHVPTVLSLDTMPTTTPELPVSYCQRPCPPLRNPKESPHVHANADDDVDHADADDDYPGHECLSCLGVLATSPTMRSEVAVISPIHDVEQSEICPMPKEAILARAWRPTLAPHTQRF